MRVLIVLLLLIASGGLLAQIKPDRLLQDFGHIELFNNDTAYFTISNTGTKTAYLLPTQPDPYYAVLSSGNNIAPGESMRIAIVYYTDKKGRFSVQVPVYFSSASTPLIFNIKGNIRDIRETAFNTCPSVENSKPLQPSQIPLRVTVKDAISGEAIKGARVDASDRHYVMHCVPGFESSALRCNVAYGPLQISAHKTGYYSSEVYFTYTDKNYHCEILLNPVLDSLVFTETEQETERKPDKKQSDRKAESDTGKDTTEPFYIPASQNRDRLDEQLYKPNHLVFIVDISGSMKDSSKLAYLKLSMKKLISEIRPGDHITLITYASKVKVVFENFSGLDKQSIYTALDTLKAAGGSNGSQSLVMAYQLAEQHFITGGNNQVFIATDGLLNSSKMSNEDLYRLAERNWRKNNIILSAIGFGDNEAAIAFMKKLAAKGRGNFIRISNTSSDLYNLLNEVKLQSRQR